MQVRWVDQTQYPMIVVASLSAVPQSCRTPLPNQYLDCMLLAVYTHTQFWNLVFNTDVCFLIIRTYSFGITPWIRSRSRWYYRLVLLLSNFVTNTRGQLWMKVNHVQSVVTVLRNRSEGSDAAENLGQLVRDPQVRSPWVSIQYRLMTWARG